MVKFQTFSSEVIFRVKRRNSNISLYFFVAGFSERIHIYTPIFKRCALPDTGESIRIRTMDCTQNDLRQKWLWAPGNLLINAETSTCLQTTKTNIEYIPMTLKQCDSSDLRQKWRCEGLLWGVSFNSPNITHAVRYKDRVSTLKARSVKRDVNRGNIWSVFPTENRSVCSASQDEGK